MSAGRWLKLNAERSTESVLSSMPRRLSTSELGKLAGAVHSSMRFRRSIFAPNAPSFRRSSHRASRTNSGRGSNEFEMVSIHADTAQMEGHPLWRIELAEWEMTVERHGVRTNERQKKIRQTLHKLLPLKPEAVTSIWLPALQYPKIFLNIFLFSRYQEMLSENTEYVQVSFAFVAVNHQSRLLPTDLTLQGAALPERRLRSRG